MSRYYSDTREYQKRYSIERARGLKRLVDADDARAFIQSLRGLGISDQRIAEAAGVDRTTVGNIRRGVTRQVQVSLNRRIMAIKLEDLYVGPNPLGHAPEVGAIRRIEALMCMGWRYKDMNPRLGFRADNIKTGSGWITQRKYDGIRKLYDELWNKRGPASEGCIKKLLTRGFQPPMAWDEGTIDDPNAEPYGVRRAA